MTELEKTFEYPLEGRFVGARIQYQIQSNTFTLFNNNIQIQSKIFVPTFSTGEDISILKNPESNFQEFVNLICSFIDKLNNVTNDKIDNDKVFLIASGIVTIFAMDWSRYHKKVNSRDEAGLGNYGGGRKRLEDRTVKELQQKCIKRKIKYNGLRKADLIQALRHK